MAGAGGRATWAAGAAGPPAGKRNGVAGRSRSMVAAIVALTAGAGFFVAWLWRDDVPLLFCYAATWLAFFLYSFPPYAIAQIATLAIHVPLTARCAARQASSTATSTGNSCSPAASHTTPIVPRSLNRNGGNE